MTTTTDKPGLIFKKIPAIMAEIPSIGKNRKNEAQHYQFRGIDDVYNLVQPIFAKHGVFMTCEVVGDKDPEERTARSGSTLFSRRTIFRYSLWADDGSHVSTDAVGEGMDSGDKASNKAMSVAQKYAILQMFLVPTDEPKDPENDNHEVKPKPKAKSGPDPMLGTITDDQRVVLAKLLGDRVEAGDDRDELVAKVESWAKISGGGYPGELSEEQAGKLIKKWSKS